MLLFYSFHHSEVDLSPLNYSFIFLTPKKEGDKHVKDFCPISMVNDLIKIVSKVLVNQLKSCPTLSALHNPPSSTSAAFWTAVSCTNKTISYGIKNGSKGFSIKLDFRKAFNSIC